MKGAIPIYTALACILLGCSARYRTTESPMLGASKHPTTINITERLRAVPVPVPPTTPYDADARKKDAYLSGFRDGWEQGITGTLKYATFGSPVSLSPDLAQSWIEGWKAGSNAGGDRWFEELGKVLDTLTTQESTSETAGQPAVSGHYRFSTPDLRIDLDILANGTYHASMDAWAHVTEESGHWRAEGASILLERRSGGLQLQIRRLVAVRQSPPGNLQIVEADTKISHSIVFSKD